MRFYDSDVFRPDNSIGYLIRRAHQLSQTALEPVYTEAGLNGTQWSALMLVLCGRCSTSAELARDLAYDKGAMTRLVDQLEARGLLSRDRGRDDRRLLHLSLTEAGQAFAIAAKARVIDKWNDWLADWERADVVTLIDLLRRLDSKLEAQAARPCGPRNAPDEAHDA